MMLLQMKWARVLRPAAALVLTIAVQAHAQPARLPIDFQSKSALTAADESVLGEFVADQVSRLSSDDPEASKAARQALHAPLDERDATVVFRLKYGELLEPRLTELARGQRPDVAVNALRLAGRVATAQSERTLRAGLQSTSPAVRFGAAVGYQELLRTVAGGAQTLGDAAVDRAIDTLRDALKKETDAPTAEGMLLALGAGQFTGSGSTLGVRAQLRACDALTDRFKQLSTDGPGDRGAAWAAAGLRGLDTAYRTMLGQLQSGAGGAQDAGFATAAGRASGHAMAYARNRLFSLAGDDSAAAERDALRRLVGAAETLLLLADGRNNPGARPQSRDLPAQWDQALTRGEPAWFEKAVEPYIGSAGLLTKPPYAVPAAQLARPNN